MLKALHALQKENQRLQEQILSLTAKKERLQILNVQLSVPFPALPAVLPAANGPVPGPYGLPPQAGSSDSLSTSKSPPGKNSLGLDNSLSTSSEVGTTGRGIGDEQEMGGRKVLLVPPLYPAALGGWAMKSLSNRLTDLFISSLDK